MKNQLTIFFVFTSLSLCNSPGQTRDTIFSLQFVTIDTLNDSLYLENLPLCKYSDGKYESISTFIIKRSKKPTDVEGFILNRIKSFRVFKRGKVIGTTKVKKIIAEQYDCNQILIGRCESDFSPEYFKYKNNNDWFSHYTFIKPANVDYYQYYYDDRNEVEGFRNQFYGINESSPAVLTQERTVPVNLKPGKLLNKKLSEYLINEYSPYIKTAVEKDNIIINDIFTYDLYGDKQFKYVVESTYRDSLHLVSVISNNNDILTGELNLFQNENERFSISYKFLEMIDLNADFIPEIIIESKGYESTGYEIYSFNVKGELIKVYDVVLYGC